MHDLKKLNSLLNQGKKLKQKLEKKIAGYKTENKYKRIAKEQLKIIRGQINVIENDIKKSDKGKSKTKVTAIVETKTKAKQNKSRMKELISEVLGKLVKDPSNRAKLKLA